MKVLALVAVASENTLLADAMAGVRVTDCRVAAQRITFAFDAALSDVAVSDLASFARSASEARFAFTLPGDGIALHFG